MKKYETEKEGQLEFLNDYLKLVDKNLSIDDVLSDYTDGIINGNILEFKLNINYTSTVLMQVIKYLSALRIKGKSIPKNILLISLNEGICYVYNSNNYLKEIEKVYIGSASKGNHNFIIGDTVKILKYKENELGEVELIKLLKEKEYTKINIDENCIVGWAERFYKENPNANKADFIGDLESKIKIIGEIRQPDKFKNFILPYTGKTNIKFQYLMDKLNDNLNKKKLGAFYTPELYVEKALELVREAIKKVPKGNDYIILDRCAGTGNLEKLMSEEELSHCIISTIEYYEYKVLLEILGDKVRHIIPHIIGYMVVKSTFDNPDLNSSLLISTRYDGAGTYLRKDLFLQLLPVFSAGRYIKYNSNWTERGRIMKSADMKDKYLKDLESGKLNIFLLKNLLYVCFEPQNHCRSLKGTDNRFYRNELCLDTTNGKTIASNHLKNLEMNLLERQMIETWEKILIQIKRTKEYNKKLTYGLYQIEQEINLKDKKQKKVFYYPELNSDILLLKKYLKEYYLKEIAPILFEYEFIK